MLIVTGGIPVSSFFCFSAAQNDHEFNSAPPPRRRKTKQGVGRTFYNQAYALCLFRFEVLVDALGGFAAIANGVDNKAWAAG